MTDVENRGLTPVESTVIRNCVFAADAAVTNAMQRDPRILKSSSKMMEIGVAAAIKAGLLNGVLATTDKAEKPYWFQTSFDDEG